MSPQKISDKLMSWASEVDVQTLQQAERASRLPIIDGHVALMPDAHFGIGATVGSVIPTQGAIIPAAVGVDLGCGMVAVETTLSAGQLPDSLEGYQSIVAKAVPAGLGKWHAEPTKQACDWYEDNPPPRPLGDLTRRAIDQLGTLGSGNHFFEVCLDERDVVWIVLHSGSRGIGNKLATIHINKAKKLAKDLSLRLEDPDLAYFLDVQPEFQAYIADMLWCQDYAKANRDLMMNAALRQFLRFVGTGKEKRRINCHHNFTQVERHGDRNVWITRKGAIKADTNDYGVIPGSMGTRSYVVKGLGNPLSYNSCSHGAGRLMSRGEARRTFTAKDLREQMGDRVWQVDQASELVDEIPSCYKDIDQVMRDQEDLVKVERTLHQIFNYKGV